MRWFIQVLLIPLCALACNSGGGLGGGKDANPPADTASLSLPDGLVPVGCPPDVGNEIGIGKPCTATGTECTGGTQCLCKDWFGYTMPVGTPCFCTNVYFAPTCTSCGSNASCCTYDVPISTPPIRMSACFPSVCLTGSQCPAIAF